MIGKPENEADDTIIDRNNRAVWEGPKRQLREMVQARGQALNLPPPQDVPGMTFTAWNRNGCIEIR